MNEILEVVIKSQPHHFVAGMSTATTSAQKFSNVVDQMGRTLTVVGSIAERAIGSVQKFGRNMTVGGLGIAAALGGATQQAIKFDSSMRNVSTVADTSLMSMGRMGDAILGLSRKLPQGANDLAAGLYDIESSGIHGADALEVLGEAATAASAGLTNTATSAGTITAIMNAYGMSAEKAADISDILFQTVNVGVLNFSELAATTGEWVSMAASAGVAVDDASAALAAMTLAGMNAAESSTSLSRVMTEFLNPGEGMVQILEDLGFATGTAMLESKGLYGSMQMIQQATGGASEKLVKIFGDIRGARGAMALMANDGDNYARVFQSVTSETERAGAAQEAFSKQAGGRAAQLTLLKNNIEALAITIGGPFAQAMNFVLAPLLKVMNFINDMPRPIKLVMSAFLALSSAGMVLGGLFLMLRLRAALWSIGFRGASAAVTNLAGVMPHASAALGRLASVLLRIGQSGGPIGSFITSIKSSRVAVQAFSSIADRATPGVMSFVKGFSMGAIGIAAFAGAALILQDRIGNARKEGERAGKAFTKTFDRSSIEAMNSSLGDARDRIREINDDLLQGNEGLDRLSSPGRALDNFRKGVSEVLSGSQSKLLAERAAIREGMQLLEEEAVRASQRIDSAIGITMTAAPGTDLERQLDRKRDSFKRYAEDRGLDLSIDVKFEDDPQEYQRQADELSRNMADLWKEFNQGPAAISKVKSALFDLGAAFDTGKSKIEGLEKVLEAFFQADFGYPAAVDDLEGSFNDLYKQIEEFREKDTLSKALDPQSFHEDALALRSSMRGITQTFAQEAIEWAKTQDNLTGAEFLQHIDGQKAKLAEYGRSIGLTDAALKPYMDHLDKIASTREISTKFNNNADQAGNAAREYLATLGLADTEINTALRVYKDEGERGLRDYLGKLDVVDNMEVTTVMRLVKDQAITDLRAWQSSLGLTDEQINTLVRLNFEGKPGELEEEMRRLGMPQGEVQAFIEIVGKDATDVALSVLQNRLDEIQKEKFIRFKVSPEVGPELQTVENLVARITREVNSMNSLSLAAAERMKAAMNKDNPPTNKTPTWNYPGNAFPGVTTNADGSHTAQIASGIRVWAEPETGGEAYIPLSPSKRGRSLAIWQQTGKALGVRGFADGGTDFSGRVYTAPEKASEASSSGGVQDDGWSIVVNMHTVGDITNTEFRQALEDRMASLERYSDEWTQTWQEIKSTDEEAKRSQRDVADYLAEHFQRRYETGNVTPTEYRSWLEEMLSTAEVYSDEYMEWWRKLKDFDSNAKDEEKRRTEEALRQRQEAVEKEERIWEYRNRVNQLGDSEYLSMLRSRLAAEEMYSDRWFDLQDKISSKEQDVVQKQKAATEKFRSQRSNMFEAGIMSRGIYLAALHDDLKAAEEYSDEWLRIRQRISELSGESSVRALGAVTSTPFTNKFISGRTVANYFTKQAQLAVTWGQTLNQLASKGISKSILDQLVAGGPDSLPMAQALVRIYNDPNLRAQFESAQSTINGVASAFNPAPRQPTTTNFQSSSWFQPGSQGSVTVNGPLVNIEKFAAQNATDVEQLSNSISFQIRSAL